MVKRENMRTIEQVIQDKKDLKKNIESAILQFTEKNKDIELQIDISKSSIELRCDEKILTYKTKIDIVI